MSWFQADEITCVFERLSVMSPDTLVSKENHCLWDYANWTCPRVFWYSTVLVLNSYKVDMRKPEL